MKGTIPTPRQTNSIQRIHNALKGIRKARQKLKNYNASLLITVIAYQSLYGPLGQEEKSLSPKKKPPQKKDFSALAGSFLLAG